MIGVLSLLMTFSLGVSASGVLEIDPNRDYDASVEITQESRAYTVDGGPTGGALPGGELSIEQQIANAPVEEQDVLRQRAYGSRIQTRSVSAARVGGFVYFGQETKYYCVPASVKMIIRQQSGISYTQASLAKMMRTTTSGTIWSEGIDVINQYGSYQYLSDTDTSVDMLNSSLEYAITENAPSYVRAIFNKTGNWPYRTSVYHSFCVTGYSANQARYTIADPYMKPYINSGSNGTYTVTANELSTAATHYTW